MRGKNVILEWSVRATQGGLEALPILLCAAVVSDFATYSITF